MTTATWQRRPGLVLSPDGGAERARGFLNGALVLALVETEPEGPDAATVVVATDVDDRIAVIDAEHRTVVPGPELIELATALAHACGGTVTFDDIIVGAAEQDSAEQPEDNDRDPFDPEIDPASAYVPDRSVVYSRTDDDGLSALASTIDMPVLAAPHLDGHLVLVTDGPALSALEWPESLKPALVIEQGAAYPAAAVVDGAHTHVHTWQTQVQVVPETPEISDVVHAFADGTLATGAFVGEVMGMLPNLEPTAVRAALEGKGAGPAAFVAALGLPRELISFLAHGDEPPALPGATVQHPDGIAEVLARAMTDAQSQMSVSMREQTELMRERAESARVRAESAFDAAETFTEEVVLPIRQSWMTPAVAALEAVGGAFALRRAGSGARAGTGTSAGERVLAVVGSLLLVDAVVNAGLFLAARRRRDNV